MNSLANYSRGNALNKEWIDLYLNEAHSQGLRSVRCHCNVVVWAENEAELKRLRNDVGSQLATMGCTPHHNTVDVPVLFWAAIPGNEADFPAEESFLTFLEQGGLPLQRRNELPLIALALRHQDGRPAHGGPAPSGHLGPSDEARHHHQPQQVHPGALG